jgi:hypothetical protein
VRHHLGNFGMTATSRGCSDFQSGISSRIAVIATYERV